MNRSHWFPDNCPVRQRTGDGVSVGRCWHYIGEAGVCEIHGDISKLPEGYERPEDAGKPLHGQDRERKEREG